jgi:2-methoxy-6-polyprenyl-1,4-benzoquinol methylase
VANKTNMTDEHSSIAFSLQLTKHLLFQEKFAQMIQEAGFERVEYENLVGGVVAIHSGLKL